MRIEWEIHVASSFIATKTNYFSKKKINIHLTKLRYLRDYLFIIIAMSFILFVLDRSKFSLFSV